MDVRDRLARWAAQHPTVAEVGGGVAAGLLVLAATLSQWGATSDSLFRGLTLGTWLGVLVAYVLRRRRRRAEQSARAALEERLRIARELHDTVAGAVGAIGIQAAAARRVLATRPEEAGRALARIEETSRAANEDLRRMLTALRGGSPAGVEREVGLAGLGSLVVDTRAAGPDVRLDVDPAALAIADRDVDRAAFRIIQEALTNVVRHAGAVQVRVSVAVEAGRRLAIGVVSGPPRDAPGAPGAGLGLVGMRERAASLGGSLAAGPTADGGFEVRAWLPLDPRAGAGTAGAARAGTGRSP